MKKILFGITGLTVGGAEKVLVDLANELSNIYDINIFTLYSKGELQNSLNKNIKINSLCDKSFNELSKFEKIKISFKILFFKNNIYKKYIKNNYDVEIAFLEGPITTLFSNKISKAKKIAWIHNDIKSVFGTGIKSKIKKILNKKIYNKYDKLIFVSKNNLEQFNNLYNIPVEKEVIYNYLNTSNIIKKANEFNPNFSSDTINFVTVCRLVEQKALNRLIKIHNKLIKEGLNHKFYIVGDGPLKQQLESQIKKLNLIQSFILCGKQLNPYPYILNADYFCLLSYYEGYGMVLDEAKALNKYILITNTASKEAVQNYENKQIFENNEEQIYEGLKNIILNRPNIENQNNNKNGNDKIIEQLKKLLGE